MKNNMIYSILVSLILVIAGAATAYDYVDIGDAASESGHAMSSWGPIEPASSGGHYGGIDHCRAIWASDDNSRTATIDLLFAGGPELLAFKHLEGIADDGFEVRIDGNLVYTHYESADTEVWYVAGVNVDVSMGTHTVEFRATGDAWSLWQDYGQVCIAEIWVGYGVVPDEAQTWSSVKSLFR